MLDIELTRPEIRSAIIGMVYGDGYLCIQGRGKHNCELRISHCLAQVPYGIWKASIMEQLVQHPIQPKNYLTAVVKTTNKRYEFTRFSSGNHRYFSHMRKLLYPAGVKTFTQKMLNYLTPLGLAIWYQDDGSLNITKRDGKLRGRQGFLHTACPLDQAELIINYFLDTWGILWKSFRVRKDSDNFSLRTNATNAIKFFKIISRYIHPSMKYKIDMQYHNNRGKVYKHVRERIADLKIHNLYFGSEDIVPSLPSF